MFYNCPVRKLASHSPPFYEKTTHTQAHSRAQTHTRGHGHTLVDTGSDAPAQMYGPRSSCWLGALRWAWGCGERTLTGDQPAHLRFGTRPPPVPWAPLAAAVSALGRQGPRSSCGLCVAGKLHPVFPGGSPQGPGVRRQLPMSLLWQPQGPLEGQRLTGLLFFIIREVGVGTPVLEEKSDMQGPCLR